MPDTISLSAELLAALAELIRPTPARRPTVKPPPPPRPVAKDAPLVVRLFRPAPDVTIVPPAPVVVVPVREPAPVPGPPAVFHGFKFRAGSAARPS